MYLHAMRLVVPMRREYGKNIDVQNFLYDLSYAREILRLAIDSKNERLKENAEQLARIVFGLQESELLGNGSAIEVRSEEKLAVAEMICIDAQCVVDPGLTVRVAEENFERS
jgi:hypothetical protein